MGCVCSRRHSDKDVPRPLAAAYDARRARYGPGDYDSGELAIPPPPPKPPKVLSVYLLQIISLHAIPFLFRFRAVHPGVARTRPIDSPSLRNRSFIAACMCPPARDRGRPSLHWSSRDRGRGRPCRRSLLARPENLQLLHQGMVIIRLVASS